MPLHSVFVYGTLKRGQPNTHIMMNGERGKAIFVCEGRTKERFPMVIASPFNAPFCINKPNSGEHIRGELYHVDDELLAFLDLMEDIPRLYQRHTNTICLKDNKEVEAQTYVLCDYKESLLSLPFLHDYDSMGTHKLPYIPRHLGDKDMSIFEVTKSGKRYEFAVEFC